MNSLVKETEIEVELNNCKLSNTNVEGITKVDGRIGRGFCRGFLNRNSHMIFQKSGTKFELNRPNWSTHSNFFDVCDDISSEISEAGAAIDHDEPVWMSYLGTIIDSKDDAFVYKVTPVM